MSDHERQEFCRQLKVIRERQKISLAQIAEATKIRAALFEELERNDLRHWPQGLYRRAYFRDYARLLGVPLDETCDEFKRLFTDEVTPAAPPAGHPPPMREARITAESLRLVLDARWHGPKAPVLSRLLAAITDAVLVAIIAGVTMVLSGFDAVVTIAAVTLAYFSLGTVLFGESPAKWTMARRDAILAAFSSGETDVRAEPAADEHGPRPWVSDATRVGPSPPPQLRVRFKV